MDRNCVNGCYVIFLVRGAISALLLTIAGAFEMPSHMLIWTAVWIVASLAISMAVPGGGGFALSEVFTLFYCSQWWSFVADVTIMRQNRYSKDVNPIAYIVPFMAAVTLWYIGYIIRCKIDENREAKNSADYYRKKAEEDPHSKCAHQEAEEADTQADPVQAVEVIEAEPAPEPVQNTVQNPDADEERHLAEEARRKAEEAQKEAEEARQRVEEAQKRAERAAQKMEDAMKRAKLAQEQLKKAQAEAEKLKNQNKKT